MLAFILRETDTFRRTHGFDPNVLYLNMKQFRALQVCVPELFEDGQSVSLGLSLVILPEDALSHPRVGFIRAIDEQPVYRWNEDVTSIV